MILHLIILTSQESQELQTSKRQKVEVIEKETILPIDRSTEVEDILSGKVLDTDIPGLEELMSTESKLFQPHQFRFKYVIIILRS